MDPDLQTTTRDENSSLGPDPSNTSSEKTTTSTVLGDTDFGRQTTGVNSDVAGDAFRMGYQTLSAREPGFVGPCLRSSEPAPPSAMLSRSRRLEGQDRAPNKQEQSNLASIGKGIPAKRDEEFPLHFEGQKAKATWAIVSRQKGSPDCTNHQQLHCAGALVCVT